MRSVLRVLASARLRALLSLGMVLGLGTVGTLAAWSATTTTTSGVFTTGSIDIKVSGDDGNPTPVTVSFAAPQSLLPGQSLAATLPITSTGSLGFTYTVAARGTDTFGQGLQLTVRAAGTVTSNTCSGGTLLGTAATQLTATDQTFGAARALGATSGAETLCFQFTLPTSAPNALQGLTGNVRLTFAATSV